MDKSKKLKLDQARLERQIEWCEGVLKDGIWKTLWVHGGTFFLIFTPLQILTLGYPDYVTALRERWLFFLFAGAVAGLALGIAYYGYARWSYKRLKRKLEER